MNTIWNPVTNRFTKTNSAAGKVLVFFRDEKGYSIDKPKPIPKYDNKDVTALEYLQSIWSPYYENAFIDTGNPKQTRYAIYEPRNRGRSIWFTGIVELQGQMTHQHASDFESDFFQGVNQLSGVLKHPITKRVKALELQHTQQEQLDNKMGKKWGYDSDEYIVWMEDNLKDYAYIIGEIMLDKAGFKDVTDILKFNPRFELDE